MKANETHEIFGHRCGNQGHHGERKFDDYLVHPPVVRPKSKSQKNQKPEQVEIDQLIAAQGILPIADLSIFAGAIPDEDVDDFVADIYRDRKA